jgi:hypothetical protein
MHDSLRLIGATTPTAPSWDGIAYDLNSKVGMVISLGDAWMTSNPPGYVNAVYSYQQAGQAGASVVGPEIDAAGAPNSTQPLTQKAWTLNSALASVNSTTSTEADAELAQGYAKQMYGLYQQAIAMGRGGVVSTSRLWIRGLWLGGIAGLGYFLYEKSRGGHHGSRHR